MQARIHGRSRSSEDFLLGNELEDEIPGRRAPLWVPDCASPSCQECAKTFNFITRRHHCRCCGRLLCDSCSSHTYPLQYLNFYPARVCQNCKVKLNSSRTTPRSRSLSNISDLTVSRLVREMQLESDRRRGSASPPLGDCLVNMLPQEILSKIFDYLRHSDKIVCRCVCHHWLQAIETSDFNKKNMVHLKNVAQGKLSDTLRTYSHGPRVPENFRFAGLFIVPTHDLWHEAASVIRVLEFVDCEVWEKDLVTILEGLQHLQRLSLVNCREVFMSGNFLGNQAESMVVGKSLARLKSLVLDNNSYLSDILLLRLTEVTPVLSHLSVAGCNMMNDPGIYAKHYPSSQNITASPSVLTWRVLVTVVRNLAKTLTSLDVSRNTGIDLEMLSGIEDMSLKTINLSSCSSSSQEGFLHLLQTNPSLTNINITNCRRIFSGLSESYKDLFHSMENISDLNLSLLSMPYFKEIGALKGIRHLVLDNLDSPASQVIQGLQSLELSRLRSMRARFLGIPSSDLVHLLTSKKFSSLRRLDLSSGNEGVITDATLKAICVAMPDLIDLNLSNNPSISDFGTLGLENNNLEAGEVILGNKILLGSRHEKEICLQSQREKCMKAFLEAQSSDLASAGLRLLTKLVTLNLSFTGISSLTLTHGVLAPDLRTAQFNSCFRVEDEGLYEFGTRHPHLESVELRTCPLSDTGLISFISCLPRLINLDLSSSPNITSSGVKAIGQVAPQIQNLLLSNCPEVSLESARYLETSMASLKVCDTHGLNNEHRGFSLVGKTVPPPPPPPPPT